MSWQMKLFLGINAVALAYCAYHAVCIVRELRDRQRSKVKGPRPRPSTFDRSLVSLLSLSRALEAA